jgi:type I restriction-modification system DNA methylase subunit
MEAETDISKLDSVDGVGKKTISNLRQNGYTSIKDLKNSTDSELLEIRGVGKQTLYNLKMFWERLEERHIQAKKDAKKELEKQLNKFDERKQELKGDYNETQARADWINPFFEKVLGWDVKNEESLPEPHRDVIHEDNVEINGGSKSPDYCFTIRGDKKFFVEAKKPAINIDEDPSPALQVRRYAWNAKLPLSIVTDFEELAVYECNLKPKKSDTSKTSRIKYLNYQDYLNEFDYLWNHFSRLAVKNGSIDEYANQVKEKKGSEPVDEEFLGDIKNWRVELAQDIALKNKELDEDEINYAVQKIIDRLVFLRMCEDRKVEEYGRLKKCIGNGGTYQNLFDLFSVMEQKYNSELFDFDKDNITKSLEVDDSVIEEIVEDFYFPRSPYEFSAIPSDILGQVYERFLGEKIRLTHEHSAKIEQKPEVRKAGGVYYTPSYIVDYIIENTIGKLIEGKTPKQIEKMKIVDPACGSGSFLIGAYQYLLDYHLKYYHDNPSKENGELTPNGNLTTSEKKRILVNNIYGVDIDAQAVEVTKLNLVLKAMEGETKQSINAQLKLLHEPVLPTLSHNIKCGNSIVGHDVFEKCPGLSTDQTKEINAFDWQLEFDEVFKEGGFDAVIGNPPWVSLSGKFANDILEDNIQDYLTQTYQGDTYRPNLYEYFVSKGLQLVKEEGMFSFVVPDRLGQNKQFKSLRERILNSMRIEKLCYKVPFPDITADTLIFVFSNINPNEDHKVETVEYEKSPIDIPQRLYINDSECSWFYYKNLKVMELAQKLESHQKTKKLKEFCRVSGGFIGQSSLITDVMKSDDQDKVVKGKSINRYQVYDCVWFDFDLDNLKGGTRDTQKLGAQPKILIRKTGDRLICAVEETGLFPEQSLYFLYEFNDNISHWYLLSVLNSKLLTGYFRASSLTNKDSIAQVKKYHLVRMPIFDIDFTISAEKELHDNLVSKAKEITNLKHEISETQNPHTKKTLKRRVRSNNADVDRIVYDLYGLSSEEIDVVENI